MSKIHYTLAIVCILLAAPAYSQESDTLVFLQSDTIWFEDGSLYIGQIADSLFNGTGKMIYADSTVYEGSWKDGMWDGYGVLQYPDGDRYEGEFSHHQFEGEGKYYYTGGAYYKGEWKNGKFDGVGTLRYEDGSYYAGEWTEDRRNGYGVLFSTSNNVMISGTFLDDEILTVDGEEAEYIEAYDPPFTNTLSFTSGMGQPFGIQYLASVDGSFVGLSLSMDFCSRARGEESFYLDDEGGRHELVWWDEKPNEIIYQGDYIPMALYLDFGYREGKLGFGASIGGGITARYRNCIASDNTVFAKGTSYYMTQITGLKTGYRLFCQYRAGRFHERKTIYGTDSHIRTELIFTLGYGNLDKLYFGIGYMF